MAQLHWQTQESPFKGIMETALTAAKQASPSIDTAFRFGSDKFVTPDEYFNGDYADKAIQAQQGMWDKYNALQEQSNQDREKYFNNRSSWLDEKERLIGLMEQNSNTNNYGSTGTVKQIDYSKDYFKSSAPTIIKEAINAGIDPNTLFALAYNESKFNPQAQNNYYGGLFAINKSQHKDWGDLTYNTKEAIKIYNQNKDYFKKAGLDWNAGTAYLAHQQGLGGAKALLQNGDLPVAEALQKTKQWSNKSLDWIKEHIVKANGGNVNGTAREFANLWIGKTNGIIEQFKSREKQFGSWEQYLKGNI